MRNFVVKFIESAESYSIKLIVDGTETAQGVFDFELNEGSRIGDVIAKIEQGDCHLDDLRDVGSQLFVGIFSGEVGLLFDRVRAEVTVGSQEYTIRLSLPPRLQLLPWEALYDERKDSFLVSNPNYRLLREPPEGLDPVRPRHKEGLPLKVLVVIPEGSGLSVDHEWRNLNLSVGKLKDALELERLSGRVTPDLLQEKLSDKEWDVFHFIGHGEVAQDGSFKIRLNSEESHDVELWMEGETFSGLFYRHAPRLVFLNCCLGAAASPVRNLSGLAPSLLRAGVPAVVAMRYEIQDDVALKFADTFYRELLTGERPGWVDVAMGNARQAVYRNRGESNVRGFITPVLYLIGDHEPLFSIPAVQRPVTSPTQAISSLPAESYLPEELAEALRNRRCIPVVGPDILRVGASRLITPPLGPKQLAEKLGLASEYPGAAEFKDFEKHGDWMDSLLLAWVCEHYQNQKQRYRLIEAVRREYEKAEPSSGMLAIAALDVPALVYTHFDGLLEEALHRTHKSVQTLNRVDQRCEIDPEQAVLVNLRGTLGDEKSLVLTEEDHEVLWDRIGKLPRQVVELLRGRLGRSALFVGISPRDGLIRRLCRQMLEEKRNKVQGPTYFVYSQATKSDEAYWEKYDVHWIRWSIDDFLQALNRAVA